MEISSVTSPKDKTKEDQRRLQWQLEDDTENLEHHTPKEENMLPTFPESSCEAFSHIDFFARKLNAEKSWKVPEFVIVGKKGSGKSTFLECFVGHPLFEGSTQRPIFFSMVNNHHCEEPRITIKADNFLKNEEFLTDEVVELNNVAEALEERNIQTDKAIYIKYEYKYCWDVTFIDTPGLTEEEDGTFYREKIIFELAQPSHRFIIFLEETQDWKNTQMFEFSKKIDPKLFRSIFIFTKFHYFLKDFSTAREVNMYLSGRPPPRVSSFFVSMLSSKVKQRNSTPEQFRLKIEQATQRDIDLMEYLKVDMSSKIFGLPSIKRNILEKIWKQYHSCIPNVLKHLRALKKERADNLQAIQEQIQTLDKNQLRSVASNYITNFGQIAKDILLGSVEIGNLSSLGQLIEEEKRIIGDWYDMHGNMITFDPKDWNIPKYDSKLCGGQQFERLLEEFKIVATKISFNHLTDDDVITACGVNGLKSLSGHMWGASDISQKKCQDVFAPLVEHLFSRASYIIKRIPYIVPMVMDIKQRSHKTRSEIKTIKASDHKSFQFYVYDIFGDFVDRVVSDCKERCMDEIGNLHVVFWNSRNKERIFQDVNQNNLGKSKFVLDFARKIYDEHKERITHNILLKCYEYLIVKMAEMMPSAIHTASINLSDDELSQMFDLATTFKKLRETENNLKDLVNEDEEPEFLKASSNFKW